MQRHKRRILIKAVSSTPGSQIINKRYSFRRQAISVIEEQTEQNTRDLRGNKTGLLSGKRKGNLAQEERDTT